jgi:hypothetical protein
MGRYCTPRMDTEAKFFLNNVSFSELFIRVSCWSKAKIEFSMRPLVLKDSRREVGFGEQT